MNLLYWLKLIPWWIKTCSQCRSYEPTDGFCTNCYAVWPAYVKPSKSVYVSDVLEKIKSGAIILLFFIAIPLGGFATLIVSAIRVDSTLAFVAPAAYLLTTLSISASVSRRLDREKNNLTWWIGLSFITVANITLIFTMQFIPGI